MSTLPQSEQASETLQLTPRSFRPATHPCSERELHVHYRSTQLALCNRYLRFWRPSLCSSLSLRVFPGDIPQVPELYISLWCHCSEVPIVYGWTHFTVGTFMLQCRVNIGTLLSELKQPLLDWQAEPLVAWLVPYGKRGHNWLWLQAAGFSSSYKGCVYALPVSLGWLPLGFQTFTSHGANICEILSLARVCATRL